jgi:hypothetical protein
MANTMVQIAQEAGSSMSAIPGTAIPGSPRATHHGQRRRVGGIAASLSSEGRLSVDKRALEWVLGDSLRRDRHQSGALLGTRP